MSVKANRETWEVLDDSGLHTITATKWEIGDSLRFYDGSELVACYVSWKRFNKRYARCSLHEEMEEAAKGCMRYVQECLRRSPDGKAGWGCFDGWDPFLLRIRKAFGFDHTA